jgi:hypothetical protein
MDDGEALVVQGVEEAADGKRCDEAVRLAGMARSIASWRGWTARLETCGAQVSFGRGRPRWFAAGLNQGGGQGGVPVRGEEDRGEGRGSGSPSVAKTAGRARRRADLRRGIPQSSLWLERSSKRGEGEVARGYLYPQGCVVYGGEWRGLKRGVIPAGGFQWESNRLRRWYWRVGPGRQRKKKEEVLRTAGPVWLTGWSARSGWCLVWAPGAAQLGYALLLSFFFLIWFLFFFCFLISFITFAFQYQMTSNQMQKFSKIKNDISIQ